jgi:hypothetical protein
MPIKKIGLISGVGELPRVIALEARRMGLHVSAIILSPLENALLEKVADESYTIHVGDLGGLISLLRGSNIGDVVMAGKVPKDLLFRDKAGINPDRTAIKLLKSVKDLSDDTIMKAVIGKLEQNGIRILKTTLFTNNLIADEGVLTQKQPERQEWIDICFGWDVARKIGRMQIGQTVVVRDRAVMAVEAIEGTDQAIKRGGKLAGRGAVVIKLSRPGQDMRYDVPVVGMKTLRAMKNAEASVLAIEARRCIIVDKERFIRRANEDGISVIGISRKMLKQFS